MPRLLKMKTSLTIIFLITSSVMLTGCAHWSVSWTGHCPPSQSIKGNADSKYYHLPADQYYSLTKAEFCFENEETARRQGYDRVPH